MTWSGLEGGWGGVGCEGREGGYLVNQHLPKSRVKVLSKFSMYSDYKANVYSLKVEHFIMNKWVQQRFFPSELQEP